MPGDVSKAIWRKCPQLPPPGFVPVRLSTLRLKRGSVSSSNPPVNGKKLLTFASGETFAGGFKISTAAPPIASPTLPFDEHRPSTSEPSTSPDHGPLVTV